MPLGSWDDSAVTDPAARGSVISLLKGLLTKIVAGATSALKLEDAAHASGDAGVMPLAVRKDTAAGLAGADGDYAPLEVDASGNLWTKDSAADAVLGTTAGAAVITDAAGTIQQYLRGLIAQFATFLSRLPAALGAGGGLKVDGSGTALPVSGSVTVSGTATVTQGTAGASAWPVTEYPVACASTDVHAPAVNTAAVVTYAQSANVKHVITGIAWSYAGGIPSGGNLKVEDVSGTTVFTMDITDKGAGFIMFPKPKKSAAVNTAMIITLAAGGAGVTGKVSVANHWTEA